MKDWMWADQKVVLKDWMKVAIPLLYKDWDSKTFESGGHRVPYHTGLHLPLSFFERYR